MNRNCKCGGRLKRLDIVGEYDKKLKRIMYSDTNPDVARFQCEKCGRNYSQRKRKSNK